MRTPAKPPLLALAIGLFVQLLPTLAAAQQISIDFGDQSSLTLRSIQLFTLITLLSLAPGLAIMITCFPFLVTVFSILRQAIGLQQAPPNMMIVSLALFLTYFVMEPVFSRAWAEGIEPLLAGSIPPEEAFDLTLGPFRTFMLARVDPDVVTALNNARGKSAVPAEAGGIGLDTLLPAFLLSEIQRAFEIGFLVFMPFLIIDLVVAAVLMSMGMMMVPPAIVSLPFKLAFFVVADGWGLLSGALVKGYL
jgi:flagellar biosynthesis protein FliP